LAGAVPVTLRRVTSALWTAVHEADGGGPRAAVDIVVFVHGSMDRSAGFAKVARRVPGVDALRYDRRGYARSLGALPPSTIGLDIHGHADDVLALVDGRTAVLAGHSLGGDIALAAAQRAPDLIRGVVAYEAPMAWEPWWPGVTAGGAAMAGSADGPEQAAEQFLRRMIGDERWDGLSSKVRHARRAEGWALVGELRSMYAGPPYDIGALPMPVIAGRGSASAPHHRRAVSELADRAERGELHEIDGAAHNAHVTHPEGFAALVRRALALTMP
jgi:pimeloyl-ACP methyl ester carboxylesterase